MEDKVKSGGRLSEKGESATSYVTIAFQPPEVSVSMGAAFGTYLPISFYLSPSFSLSLKESNNILEIQPRSIKQPINHVTEMGFLKVRGESQPNFPKERYAINSTGVLLPL